ncbi:MAG: agmatinase [Bacteroidales bacterium]|nr:agmatinase [Bacteroidales bacterium]
MINFAEIPDKFCQYDTSQIVILPVPYDGTSTWLKGADKGPEALIESSINMEWYDIETEIEPYKMGMFIDKPLEGYIRPEELLNPVYDRVRTHIENRKFVFTLGGEHSVCLGAIKAYFDMFSNLTIIQFDAHTDLRQEYLGSKYNHACVMARIKDFTSNIVQIGIRSLDITEKNDILPGRIFYAENIVGKTDWHESLLSHLTDNVYITFDLDVFDPSIMSSTGTPEPGGMLWYETIQLLKKIIQKKNLVGMDIVELCPNAANKAPDYLAAKLLYKVMAYWGVKKRSSSSSSSSSSFL